MLIMLAEQYFNELEGHHSQDCTTLRYVSSKQIPRSVNRLSRISALSTGSSAASELRPTSTSAQVDQSHNAPLVFLASQREIYNFIKDELDRLNMLCERVHEYLPCIQRAPKRGPNSELII